MIIYSQDEINKVHDIYNDLIVSLFFKLPIEKRLERPLIGDWCICSERLTVKRNIDDCIGILKSNNESLGEYVIETIGGKEVHWHNTEFKKLPVDFMRDTL